MKKLIILAIIMLMAVPAFAADFYLSITITDNSVQDVVAALNWHYGQVEDPADSGIYRDRTGAELRALVNAGTIQAIKNIYVRHQRYLAEQTLVTTPPDIQ